MSTNNQTELSELIDGIRANKRKSQKRLYEKYFGLMMSISMRYCGNWDEASEVVNSGFLKVFLKIDKYSGKGSFEGWMKRIIVNTALDHIKSLKLESVELNDNNIFESDFYFENDALSDFNVEEILDYVQMLPPMTRAVFNMNIMEGMKHKEISDKLNISEGTSHWHLQNARKILRGNIDRHNYSK
ncbi:MAG: sigma-70 family RNA polymerase sigma factor [Bacteroidetes bacterium]|nr:MAG: sigma-70 family RNA polymerase sigma factor [Bacteroidota bacterium]